jgi:regulator of cell morphogenesis and NO signaling
VSDLDLESSVPDWLIEHPRLWSLFEELGIDYSCGGKSLGVSCRERGLIAAAVLQQCEERLHGTPRSDDCSRRQP